MTARRKASEQLRSHHWYRVQVLHTSGYSLAH